MVQPKAPLGGDVASLAANQPLNEVRGLGLKLEKVVQQPKRQCLDEVQEGGNYSLLHGALHDQREAEQEPDLEQPRHGQRGLVDPEIVVSHPCQREEHHGHDVQVNGHRHQGVVDEEPVRPEEHPHLHKRVGRLVEVVDVPGPHLLRGGLRELLLKQEGRPNRGLLPFLHLQPLHVLDSLATAHHLVAQEDVLGSVHEVVGVAQPTARAHPVPVHEVRVAVVQAGTQGPPADPLVNRGEAELCLPSHLAHHGEVPSVLPLSEANHTVGRHHFARNQVLRPEGLLKGPDRGAEVALQQEGQLERVLQGGALVHVHHPNHLPHHKRNGVVLVLCLGLRGEGVVGAQRAWPVDVEDPLILPAPAQGAELPVVVGVHQIPPVQPQRRGGEQSVDVLGLRLSRLGVEQLVGNHKLELRRRNLGKLVLIQALRYGQRLVLQRCQKLQPIPPLHNALDQPDEGLPMHRGPQPHLQHHKLVAEDTLILFEEHLQHLVVGLPQQAGVGPEVLVLLEILLQPVHEILPLVAVYARQVLQARDLGVPPAVHLALVVGVDQLLDTVHHRLCGAWRQQGHRGHGKDTVGSAEVASLRPLGPLLGPVAGPDGLQRPQEVDDPPEGLLVARGPDEQRVGVLDALLDFIELPPHCLVLVQRPERDLQGKVLVVVQQPVLVERLDEPVPQQHLVVLAQ
eukprot:RCo003308